MSDLLDKIDRPSTLKNLNIAGLERLCNEIRERIIKVVSKTGGHIAPSLGTVELTIALNYVFDTPVDKIIWDVGHQSYAHKIITGRNKKFDTLRQYGGISGFPNRTESEYDVFGTGHASTSISAALGIACARDLNKDNFSVVAVIGDGAMSGGIAFEALNNAGAMGKKLIVVLNDNEMSISKNVGALSKYFNKLISTPIYRKIRNDVEELIHKIPAIGTNIGSAVKKIEEGIKNFFIPDLIFEELGFHYYGPINGHNLEELIEIFQMIRSVNGPVIVHCITQKGRGYTYAEEDPETFHGSGPFVVSNGKQNKKNSKLTYTNAFSHWICEAGDNDEKVVAITAAMAKGTGLEEFSKKYKERFFDVGIAEQHSVTFAGGLSTEGYKPVIAIYSTFLQRAFDQIIHDIALQKLQVLFAIDRGGLVGADGATHHGVFDLSYLGCIPGVVVAAPKDEEELQNLLYTGLNSNVPFAVRYPRDYTPGNKLLKYNEMKIIEIGTWEKLREGSEICILATGSMLKEAQIAAEELNCELVNARYVKPFDKKMLQEIIKKFNYIITIEENVLSGGFGSRVQYYVDKESSENTKVLSIGLPDEFVPHGDITKLKDKYGLTSPKIIENVKQFCKK